MTSRKEPSGYAKRVGWIHQMKALMHNVPLTLDLVLERCHDVGAQAEVVSVTPAGITRMSWAELAQRASRLGAVLNRLDVAEGGRVATFAWNSHRHVELFLGVPVAGRVIHGVNVRLTDDDILYQLEHATDEVLFIDASLTGRLAPLTKRLPVREIVVLDDGGVVHPAFERSRSYEQLLSSVPDQKAQQRAQPDDAAWICYTSGTTGRPKGVVASHQAALLHSMSSMTVDSHAICRADVVLAATPIFHVNAWGLPYTAALAGSKLVLPGKDVSGTALGRLIKAEQVTVGAGVPTVWSELLGPAGERHDLSSLRRLLSGGAPAPRPLLDEVQRRGLILCQGWGMTEMLPSGTMQHITPRTDLDSPAGARGRVGRPTPGIRVRLVGPTGECLPWDGTSVGELETSGLWVTSAYLDPTDDSNMTRFNDGWLRTGDLAVIHPDATVEIVDRLKDVIKSGGEWISSLAIEEALLTHPRVSDAAVVAVPDPIWGERPAAAVVATQGLPLQPEEISDFLAQLIPRWWLPKPIVIMDKLPRTTIGKHDKRALRSRLAQYADAPRTNDPVMARPSE
jgi:fatty-acyl-CoA synthase